MRLEEVLRRERASVFFHARWSGPSVAAFRLLRETMKARGISESEIAVIDVDDEEASIHQLMDAGFRFGGVGEAAVVRAGRIRYFSALFHGGEAMRHRVESFLDEHEKA